MDEGVRREIGRSTLECEGTARNHRGAPFFFPQTIWRREANQKVKWPLLRHYRSLAAANNKHSARSPANHWPPRNERLGYSKVPTPLLRTQRHPEYSAAWLIS